MRIVIIGGVAGGMSAATRLRRLDESAQITVLERSGHVSFANCGLPYHVGGVIEDRQSLLLQTPASLAARFNLDVRVRHEAVEIDRAAKRVWVRDLTTAQPNPSDHWVDYDVLILSPGARPIRPPIPGIDRALSLRNVEDTDAINARITPTTRTAVVIGGGFIGVEMAENLLRRGLDVTLVEAMPQVMTALDPEMAGFVHEQLRAHGVRLALGDSVTAIDAGTVALASGARLPADLVIAAIGVRPDISLAYRAGLTIGDLGGIVVDDQLRTSDPHIYAVGDAAQKRDALDLEPTLVPLANTANRQGRMAADIIMGRPAMDPPVHGTAIVGVCGLTVASTGWNEKRLRAAGRPYRAIHTHPASHAGYYPGAQSMSLKLLVDPQTQAILGAQAVGGEGVDRRIDVLATAMSAGLPATALCDLELAYAPQHGSAKDPVNMLGYVARNRADGAADAIQWHELADEVAAGATVLDVRSPEEFADGAIPGAVNIPIDELRDRLGDVPPGRLVVTCQVGVRGHAAARMLTQRSHDVMNLDGGYRTWAASPAGQQRSSEELSNEERMGAGVTGPA